MRKFLIIVVVNILFFSVISCDSEDKLASSENSDSKMPKGYVGSLYKAEPLSGSLKNPETIKIESDNIVDQQPIYSINIIYI